MRKDHHEPPTSRSDTMKKLDEILTSTLEVLAIVKNIKKECEGQSMKDQYKTRLIELLDKLPGKAIERLYRLAEYLYIYK